MSSNGIDVARTSATLAVALLLLTSCASSGGRKGKAPELSLAPATSSAANPDLAERLENQQNRENEARLAELEAELRLAQEKGGALQAVADFLDAELQRRRVEVSLLTAELDVAVEHLGRPGPAAPWDEARLGDRLQSVRSRHAQASSETTVSALQLELSAGYLQRAADALRSEDFSVALFLTERADALLNSPTQPPEIAAQPASIEVLVPALDLEVTTNSNLRTGPSTDFRVVRVAERGSLIRAIARSQEWLLVETESSSRVWIHGDLVKPSSRSEIVSTR